MTTVRNDPRIQSYRADGSSKPRTEDELRAQIAQWAIAQANDPNIGYSQTKGRFGNATDAEGHRYFDCSGLVFTAYQQAGITLGGNYTGAMRDSWPQWADKVPNDESQMKPGDLLLMNGHVVMYTGNGHCVGAQTSHGAFGDQVRADIPLSEYLHDSDCIVLRPHVSASQLANAPASLPLQPQTGPVSGG